jgi:hypothetical protein
VEQWFTNWKQSLAVGVLGVLLGAWLKPIPEAIPKLMLKAVRRLVQAIRAWAANVKRRKRVARALRGEYVERLSVRELMDVLKQIPVEQLHARYQAELKKMEMQTAEARRMMQLPDLWRPPR